MEMLKLAERAEGTALRICKLIDVSGEDNSPGKYRVLRDMTGTLMKRALFLWLQSWFYTFVITAIGLASDFRARWASWKRTKLRRR